MTKVRDVRKWIDGQRGITCDAVDNARARLRSNAGDDHAAAELETALQKVERMQRFSDEFRQLFEGWAAT